MSERTAARSRGRADEAFFSGDEVPLDFPDWAGAEVLVGEPGDALGPWEGRVYRRATRRE